MSPSFNDELIILIAFAFNYFSLSPPSCLVNCKTWMNNRIYIVVLRKTTRTVGKGVRRMEIEEKRRDFPFHSSPLVDLWTSLVQRIHGMKEQLQYSWRQFPSRLAINCVFHHVFSFSALDHWTHSLTTRWRVQVYQETVVEEQLVMRVKRMKGRRKSGGHKRTIPPSRDKETHTTHNTYIHIDRHNTVWLVYGMKGKREEREAKIVNVSFWFPKSNFINDYYWFFLSSLVLLSLLAILFFLLSFLSSYSFYYYYFFAFCSLTLCSPSLSFCLPLLLFSQSVGRKKRESWGREQRPADTNTEENTIAQSTCIDRVAVREWYVCMLRWRREEGPETQFSLLFSSYSSFLTRISLLILSFSLLFFRSIHFSLKSHPVPSRYILTNSWLISIARNSRIHCIPFSLLVSFLLLLLSGRSE